MTPVAGLPTTLHVTAVLALPETVALNCDVAPGESVTLVGVTVTVTLDTTLTVRTADTGPGPGFATVTFTVPGCVAVPTAVSFVAETNVVESGAPLQRTLAPLTKPLPLAVSVKAPSGSDDGATALSTGVG